MYPTESKRRNGHIARLLVVVMILSMCPIIGNMQVEEAYAAPTVIQNDSLSVRIGNIGQVELFNIRNNRNNKLTTPTQPNFVMPNTETNLSTTTHQYMGELIFSTRAADTKEGLAAKAYAEQDVNKTLAAAPAGAMTQYSNFTNANLAANPNIDINYGDNKVTVDYKGFGLNTNTARTMKGYDVRQEWDMKTPDNSLLRTITVKNVSDQYIEFGDMGLPMPWNNKYNSISATYNERMMVHNFAGADSGYTQIIRPSGEGNYVLFAPVPDSGARLEYVEYVQSLNFQGVTGYRANSVYGGLGGDDGGWQPGLNILYQHAKNVYAGNGGAYMPVSTFTSKVLAPGEEMSYQYKYFAVRAGDNSPQESASSPNNASDNEGEREANMRSILYKNGMMDMLAVPSFSTFLNMSTKLDLHYDDSRISDVQVEIMCVHENDPYDTAHIPNNGTPYNVNNSRGGPGLHNAPENAAYSRSISTPKKTVDAKGESHYVYDLSFDCIGNNSVGVSYKLNGVQKYTECEFSVMPEIKSVIDSHADFNYDRQVASGTYKGQYLESTMHGADSSNTASADDWGWDQGNFMATKNLLRPNQDEITSLESLHIDLYWGKPLINHSTWAVSNAFAGTGSRTFTHQMAATSFFTMYQIRKAYPDLKYREPLSAAEDYSAKWYLNIAYQIYYNRVTTSTTTGYYGEQFIEPLITALRTEGMTTEANNLQARFTGASSGKGYAMATANYPYGSEFAFDNTGEEGAYFSAKALRTYAPSHAQYARAYQNMLLAELKTRACRGLQPTWFHYGNVVFLGGEGWWNSQYTTPLAAAITDDYLRFQNNGYNNDERAWAERVNYAAKLSAFSHVNMGQIASTAIGNISWRYTAFKGRFGAMNVNDQNGNRIQYNGWNDFSGEADENLYGTLLRLSSDVVTDPIFGLYGYGCEATDNGNSYTVKPLDGVGKKINLLNEKIYLDFNRDEVVSATISKNGRGMTFELKNQTGTDHTTQLSLTGLPTSGKYYVVADGTHEPLSEFTVGSGSGVADITMSKDVSSVKLLVILAADYSLDGPTVLAGVSSKYTFKDAPIKLTGDVFNADEYAWRIATAPAIANAAITGGNTLTPTFTTDTAGTYVLRLTATDSALKTANADVEILVVDRATYPAPEIKTATIESGKLFPGYDYKLTGNATTGIPDGGLVYKWSGPAGVTFSDTTDTSPIVKFENPGAYALTLTVTDDIGRIATQTVNATVVALTESDPPEIKTATIQSGKLFPDFDYRLTGDATTGIPAGKLAYKWSGPEGVSFSDPAISSPTARFGAPGEYVLTLAVTDDISRTVSKPVNVTILPLTESDPPEISSATIDTASPVANTAYGLVGIATSGIPGSDALSYRWTSFPAAGVNYAGTGANSAFPSVTFTIPRTYEMTLTVTDKIGRSVSKSFSTTVTQNLAPYNVALTTKGTTLQNIHQNGGARTAPLNGGSVARAAASTLNTWGTSSTASRHWFQLTFPDKVTLYAVDIMWSSDGGGTQPPAASTSDATRNVLLVPAVNPAVPLANDALTWTAANWTRLAMQDKAGTTILDIPRVTNGTAANNVWNFAGFNPVDTQYLLMDLNRPGSGNGVGVNYWRAYALEPVRPTEDIYVRVNETELNDAARRDEVFPANFETEMKMIDFKTNQYVTLDHDIALKWTTSQITAAQNAALGTETIVTGTNATLGYNLRVHVVRGAASPTVVDYSPVAAAVELGESVSLPKTVLANLNDGSKQSLDVTWTIPADIADTAGVKSINGVVALPTGWVGDTAVTATLTVVEDARTYLSNLLKVFEALDRDEYTIATYNTALSVYTTAKRVRDYTESLSDELTSAAGDLNTAMGGLLKRANSLMLAIFENIVDKYIADFPKANYTPSSWAPFEQALNDAKAIIAAPGNYTDDDVYAVMDALIATSDALVRVADRSGLKIAIDYAENMLKPANVGKYIPVSVENLEDVLSGAAIVYADGDATQAKIDKAREDLQTAITQMYEKGDKAALQALVTLVSRYAQASYTPASWATFAKALDDARKEIANPNAITDSVNKAYTALTTAITGLARKADFAALNASILLAQEIVDNIGDYVPSTVVGLAEELGVAKAVAGNPDATQAQVNAATTALNTKILTARLRPDLSGLLSATARARTLEGSLYTVASYTSLTTAVADAEAVLSAAPEKVTQADVDGATLSVDNAIAALVLKTDIAGNDGKDIAKTVIPKVKVSKISASAKAKIVIKWAKTPAAAKVTGYQVQYRVKGASKWKTRTISAKSASLTIKSLKKNKKYQIRIRAYRSDAGKNQYGAWSAVKISKKIK